MAIQKDEKQISSASYIITLLNEVEQLLDYSSAYLNLLLELSSKYNDDDTPLTEQETQNMTQITNILRSLAYKTYTRINTILENTNDKKIKEKIKEIKQEYDLIENTRFFTFENIKKYTSLINSIFINNIAFSELIKKSKEVIEGLAR